MDIRVLRLDAAYEQCTGLLKLITGDGEKLLSDLADTINYLKRDWIGNDATTHINGLIKVYKDLHQVISDAKESVAYAGSRMVAIQTVRNKNNGQGSIGDELDGNPPMKADLPDNELTEAYDVKPECVQDLEQLIDECARFESFAQKFLGQKDELFSNWQAGAKREKAESAFNTLENNYGTYKKIMNDAKENLSVAVSNIKTLDGSEGDA